MGYYINTTSQGLLPAKGKSARLIADEGAIETHNPQYVPDRGLVCVVDNGLFEAAAFCYSAREAEEFIDDGTMRRKRWFYMDLDRAKTLSGYK